MQFILGQILGEMKGISLSITQLSTTFTAHALADEKSFSEVRNDIVNVKLKMAYYMGGAAVIGALTGWLIPLVIQQIIK